MADENLNKIIKIIKASYPVDIIDDIWDWDNSKLYDDCDQAGDTIITAIIREIYDCYDWDQSYIINLLEAHRVLALTLNDLQSIEKQINFEIVDHQKPKD